MAVRTPLCSTLLAWSLCSYGVGAQDQRPSQQLDIAGKWQVIDSLSDELPLLPGEAMALARATGVVRTGTRPARSVRGLNQGDVAKVRSAVRSALEGARELTILQDGQKLVLKDAQGRELSIVPNGQKVNLEHGGIRFTVVATWSAPVLAVERRYEDGTTLIDSYVTFSEPRQLVATSTVHNHRMDEQPVTLTRVYEVVTR